MVQRNEAMATNGTRFRSLMKEKLTICTNGQKQSATKSGQSLKFLNFRNFQILTFEGRQELLPHFHAGGVESSAFHQRHEGEEGNARRRAVAERFHHRFRHSDLETRLRPHAGRQPDPTVQRGRHEERSEEEEPQALPPVELFLAHHLLHDGGRRPDHRVHGHAFEHRVLTEKGRHSRYHRVCN